MSYIVSWGGIFDTLMMVCTIATDFAYYLENYFDMVCSFMLLYVGRSLCASHNSLTTLHRMDIYYS